MKMALARAVRLVARCEVVKDAPVLLGEGLPPPPPHCCTKCGRARRLNIWARAGIDGLPARRCGNSGGIEASWGRRFSRARESASQRCG